MHGDRIVIIGAGLAGLRAAERLREREHLGPITVIGDEPVRPYNRPPLSKQVLAGRMQPEELTLRAYDPRAALDVHVDWVLGDGASTVNPKTRTVTLRSGREIGYDGLVVASGVEARTLPGAPIHLPNVWTLRTLADCRAIDEAMTGADTVAIIGGGFIGCEVATAARQRALHTTIVDVSSTLLGHAVGPAVGAIVTDIHRHAGVHLALGRTVDQYRTVGKHVELHLDDDTSLRADVVVIGVGTKPRVSFLDGLGLDLTDGIVCTPTCHVIGLTDTVAAGDCARWPNLRFDDQPRRVEHWINAVEHARAAADALLAGPTTAVPFAPIPRFWSEQHGVKIQSIGMPRLADTVHVTPTRAGHRAIATYHRHGRLIGVIAIDEPKQLLAYTSQLANAVHDPALDAVA